MIVTKYTDVAFPSTIPVLQADPLIADGSILLYDFWRTDSFNGSISSPVFTNLAEAKAVDLGLTQDTPAFSLTSNNRITYTAEGGLKFRKNASETGGTLNFGDYLNSYLYNGGVLGPDFLFIAWIDFLVVPPNSSTARYLKWGSNTSAGNYNAWITSQSGGSTLNMNGRYGFTVISAPGLYQVAFTRQGAYKNAVLQGTSASVFGAGYPNIADSLEIGAGMNNHADNTDVFTIYRMYGEDLNESGRTALEVLQADHDYVTAYVPFAQ